MLYKFILRRKQRQRETERYVRRVGVLTLTCSELSRLTSLAGGIYRDKQTDKQTETDRQTDKEICKMGLDFLLVLAVIFKADLFGWWHIQSVLVNDNEE